MPNTIQHKRSSTSGVAPAASGLSQGELAINIADGKLYTKNNANSVINLGVTSISGTYITPSSGNFFNYLAVNGVPVSVSGHSHLTVPQAQSLVTTVFNKTANTIPKFSVVYINGGQGDQATIQLAIADGETGSSKTYGITAEAISSMSTGNVIVAGALSGVNTDVFNPTAPVGDVNGITLYLSPTVSGGITSTKPYAPNHLVSVATVVRTHQNAGVVEVKIQNGFELDELHNVAISGATNGQFLQYNSTNGLWVPSSSGNFTSLTINNNTIVTGTGVANHVAYWNSSSGIVADSGQLYWDSTNDRLGIGTTSPTANLSVTGNAVFGQTGSSIGATVSVKRIGNNYNLELVGATDGVTNFAVQGASTNMLWTSRANYFDIQTNSAGKGLALTTNGGSLFLSSVGFVGIGTTSPQDLLHISGSQTTIRLNNTLSYDTQLRLTDTASDWSVGINQGNSLGSGVFAIRSITAGSSRFVIDTNGRVGIGSTAPQAGFILDITGNTVNRGSFLLNNALQEFGNNRYQLNHLANSNSYSYVCNGGGSFGVGFAAPSGRVAISGGVAIGSNYNVTPPTNGLIIEGNVGIGTGNPDTRLVVNGNAYTVGTLGVGAACRANLTADLGSAAGLAWNDGSFVGMQYIDGANYRLGLTLHATARETRVQTKTGDNAGIITFYPRAGTTEAARFHSNNNFGIGITAPTARLHVAGSIDAGSVGSTGVSIQTSHFSTTTNGLNNTALYVNPTFNTNNSNIANTYGLLVSPVHSGTFTTTNSYGLYVNASTLVTGTLTNNYAATFMGGNVGVGTASPSYLLDINGTTRSSIFRAGAGTTDALILQSNGTGSSSRTITLQPRSLGGSRTLHIPDANADVALTYNGNAIAAGSTVNQSMSTIRNNLGDPSAEENALFHGEFYNQLRFISPSLQEESADGGTTWTTSTRMSAANLGDLMIGEGQGTSVNILPQGSSSPIAYRLTWDTTTNTLGQGYFWLNHLYIYCSTNGNTVTFTVDAFHNTNGWTQIFTGSASNYPGHVSIKHNQIAYYSTNATLYGKVRITFTSTTVSQPVTLGNIEWFGGYPAGRRNAEYYDRNKNVYFPSLVYTSGIYSTTRNYYRSSNGHEFRKSTDAAVALLDNNGYFGINTSSPSTYLHISEQIANFGSIFCSGSTTNTSIGLGNSDTVPFFANISAGNLSTSIYGWGMFYRSTDGNFQIRRKGGSTSWNDVLTIDRSNGNISINGNSPLQKLDVRGNIYASGNVGINVSSASAPLEVAATATTNVDISHFSNSNGVEKAIFSLSSAGDGILSLRDAANATGIRLTTNASTSSYINAGNFGIKTTTPAAQLHVIGSGIFSSGIAINTTNTYFEDIYAESKNAVFSVSGEALIQTSLNFYNPNQFNTFARGRITSNGDAMFNTLGVGEKADAPGNAVVMNTDGLVVNNGGGTGGTACELLSDYGAIVQPKLIINTNGNGDARLGIDTSSPTAPIDVNGNTIRLRTSRTPASGNATGNAGDICWDSSYIYVCTATNTWKRSSLSSW